MTEQFDDDELTNLPCPEPDCGGKIEARAPFWIEIAPDGRAYLGAIGWHESGSFNCSEGGEEHVTQKLMDRLEPLVSEYCAEAETILGASMGEDDMPHRKRS